MRQRAGDSIEVKWAIEQLEALGYIKTFGCEGKIAITEKGKQHALDVLKTNYDIQERLLFFLYHIEIGKYIKGGENGT